MNGKLDLHEKFIRTLNSKLAKKDIVAIVAEILKLEKDAAYRRINGKVNFSVREMGIIADRLNISLDQLKSETHDFMWVSLMLEFPYRATSTNSLFEFIKSRFDILSCLDSADTETGNIYSSLPMEYYLQSPILTKFMFFKWGYYFVKTNEFYNYSAWELPSTANGLLERLSCVYNFRKAYYIWDVSIILSLIREIHNFHKMRIITTEEKNMLKEELKNMLTIIEQTLNGNPISTSEFLSGVDFYVSAIHIGFTCNYLISSQQKQFILHTPFSFCMINDNHQNFLKLRNWVDSIRDISTLLSNSGRIERRIFFEEQHMLIDFLLN